MSDDLIQPLLTRWHTEQDRSALGRAFHLLRREWVGEVCRYVGKPAEDLDVDQALGDLLVMLLLPAPGKPPRALAPPDHTSPKRWRLRVLRNALLDQRRRQQAHERAVAETTSQQVPHTADEDPGEIIALGQMRQAVAAVLPRLEIRRRVALALALGMDVPLAWQAELAVDLGEPAIEIARRIAAVAAHPEDEETRLRVLHTQELALARDAHRKLLKRAQEEIMGLIHKGQA